MSSALRAPCSSPRQSRRGQRPGSRRQRSRQRSRPRGAPRQISIRASKQRVSQELASTARAHRSAARAVQAARATSATGRSRRRLMRGVQEAVPRHLIRARRQQRRRRQRPPRRQIACKLQAWRRGPRASVPRRVRRRPKSVLQLRRLEVRGEKQRSMGDKFAMRSACARVRLESGGVNTSVAV